MSDVLVALRVEEAKPPEGMSITRYTLEFPKYGDDMEAASIDALEDSLEKHIGELALIARADSEENRLFSTWNNKTRTWGEWQP